LITFLSFLTIKNFPVPSFLLPTTSQKRTQFKKALTVAVDPFLQYVHITGINGQLKWLAGVIPRVTTQILT
jgi:hypothetical protein